MVKHAIMTIKYDRQGRQECEEYLFDNSTEADKFLAELPNTVARQRYLKEIPVEMAVV